SAAITSLWTHCPNSGYCWSGGLKPARTPVLRVSQLEPPSCVSNAPTDEIPTQTRSASSREGTMEWRIRPPLPGCHSGRLGVFVSPSTCARVAPPSPLLNSPAGSTPAYIASPGPVARLQIVATFSLSSPYVMPSLECVHDLPRSSLRHTAGPYQLLPP